jgi:acrylyl-CoA reductase (NADPH)
MAPMALRQQAWARLAKDLDMAKLDSITKEIGMDAVIPTAAALLEGKVRGRVVVNVNT